MCKGRFSTSEKCLGLTGIKDIHPASLALEDTGTVLCEYLEGLPDGRERGE